MRAKEVINDGHLWTIALVVCVCVIVHIYMYITLFQSRGHARAAQSIMWRELVDFEPPHTQRRGLIFRCCCSPLFALIALNAIYIVCIIIIICILYIIIAEIDRRRTLPKMLYSILFIKNFIDVKAKKGAFFWHQRQRVRVHPPKKKGGILCILSAREGLLHLSLKECISRIYTSGQHREREIFAPLKRERESNTHSCKHLRERVVASYQEKKKQKKKRGVEWLI